MMTQFDGKRHDEWGQVVERFAVSVTGGKNRERFLLKICKMPNGCGETLK
jgi:hypothetical protein